MAGKPTVFVRGAAFCALDELSKNTLIDLVADLARREIGEETSDLAVVQWVQDQMAPIDRARSQKSRDLVGRLRGIERGEAKYRKDHGIPCPHDRITQIGGGDNGTPLQSLTCEICGETVLSDKQLGK